MELKSYRGYEQYNPVLQAYVVDDQSLLPPPPSAYAPPTAVTHVQVVVPHDLREGETFRATLRPLENGRFDPDALEDGPDSFVVTAPPGGVEKGQVLSVPFPRDVGLVLGGAPAGGGRGNGGGGGGRAGRSNVPVGAWRDGLFNCCAHGCFHPALWFCLCCSPVLLGQLITRLGLTCFGTPTTNRGGASAYAGQCFIWFYLFFIFVTFFLLPVLFPAPSERHDETKGEKEVDDDDSKNKEDDDNGGARLLIDMLRIAYFIFFVCTLGRVRAHVRSKYAIPLKSRNVCVGGCCSEAGLPDELVSCCCSNCITSQVARHVNDYDNFEATCCSTDGFGAEKPEIV